MKRINPQTFCLSFLMVLTYSVLSPADDLRLKLSVEESAGVSREDAAMSGGIPLPRGLFPPGQPFSLYRASGDEVPCQISPLVVDRDGALQWVLVDFQDDIDAGQTNQYELRSMAPTAVSPVELVIEETDEAVRVDTGKISFTIDKQKPFGLFDSITAEGVQVVTGGKVSYTQLYGRTGWEDDSEWQSRELFAGAPEEVRLHYAGPLRVTIEVTGKFADDPLGAGYRAFVTAWAGSSQVKVKYKLCNSNSEQYTVIPVARSSVDLTLADAGGNVVLGGRKPVRTQQDNGWLHQGLKLNDAYQDINGAVQAGSGAETLWTGNGTSDRPGGWISTTATGRSPLVVLDRHFADNPARRLAVENGHLLLEGIAEPFAAPQDKKGDRERVGQPWESEARWLYDCSHHSSEYVFDFAAAKAVPNVQAAHSSLQVLAPAEHYGRCGMLGTGQFGSLDDEKAAYEKWGWSFTDKQLPRGSQPNRKAFVDWEDNHYESEADSVQGLLAMYVRTGQRGFLDDAAAWAGYHMDLETWRTDGWHWKDGAIWFPHGGPQGNHPLRKPWNFTWGKHWGERKDSDDCADLWKAAQAKSCYCHYYGGGLVNYYFLTGDPDARAAALDNVESKEEEFQRARKFVPGKSDISSIRGFGRGFEVVMHTLMLDPENTELQELAHLCAQTLWQSPQLDERGFHASQVGGGWGGMAPKELAPPVRKWMEENGIEITQKGNFVDKLTKDGESWPVVCYSGTWQHSYVQNGADLYAKYFDDENMRDFTIAFAQMSARYMLSDKCHQTPYYAFFDVPEKGQVFDPWEFTHTDTTDGEGCRHSGYYTRFYPDCCAKGFSWTGEQHLLDKAKEFWYYGSKRSYNSTGLKGGPNEVYRFAFHDPPKNDSVLETGRLFFLAAHPREDADAPQPVTDLKVERLSDGKAWVQFTAPTDQGGGKIARYQLKMSSLPILPYEQWDPAQDVGKKRNWWMATNLNGEPTPGKAGGRESFVVSDVPKDGPLYFAIRSFDDSDNRSAIGKLAEVE